MNKELSKAIMHRSKFKNLHHETKTKESWEAFKRQQSDAESVAIKHKNVKTHFSQLAENNGLNGKKFWSAVKPFLTDKTLRRVRRLF